MLQRDDVSFRQSANETLEVSGEMKRDESSTVALDGDEPRMPEIVVHGEELFPAQKRLHSPGHSQHNVRQHCESHREPSYNPMEQIASLEANGWDIQEESESRVVATRADLTIRVKPTSLSFQGLDLAELLSEAEQSNNRELLSETLQLLAPQQATT